MKKITMLLLVVVLMGCTDKLHYSTPIYSIERDSSIGGSFFLGIGSIEGVEYFFMWADSVHYDGLLLRKIGRARCLVYEGDESPRLEKWRLGKSGETMYKVYVPNDTIFKEFKL